jgi:hypothetical protein
MPYVLFVVTPDTGTDMISQRTWDRFDRGLRDLVLSSTESVLLNRGFWQLDLSCDEAAFHLLISAAKEAEVSYRYLLSEGPISWVFS